MQREKFFAEEQYLACMLLFKTMNLVEKAKTNPESFVQLYEQHVDRVYRYLLSRVRQVQEAEDLCSKVWEAVLQGIQNFRGLDLVSFQAWIFTIARNEVNQYFKKKGRVQPFSEEFFSVLPEESPNPKESAEHKELKGELHELLEGLPEQQQESVRLKYLAGFKNKEIAILQGISEKTVASNLVRAFEKLRKAFESRQ